MPPVSLLGWDEDPMGSKARSGTGAAVGSDGRPSILTVPVLITSSLTGVKPEKPSWCAAAGVRSITRPRVKGPRSLIRTMTELPLP